MRLSIQGLSLGYGRLTAVDDVSLDIESGDMVSIVGPNGSGKSTLLRGIGRLQRPTRGRVLLGETDIRSLGARQVARQLAVLPQSPDGGADLTVRELVYRGRFPHQGILQRLTRTDFEAVDWAMKAADVELLAARTLAHLSGGERQRAWIAMALAQQPRVLLLDEPTSFLDIAHQVEVMELLQRLNHDGITVVAVLHDLALAARYTRRVIAMREGRVAFDGAPAEVMEPVGLAKVFGIAMTVLTDPESGLPIPIPRSKASLTPRDAIATDRP
ncbi:MAG: ABC transporter ATP-binding protein [Dehalococcoidia bacterium]|uniref:ABC transporter ATP-binding protein n=1 Tax=Candidatus Amarobacter glycogenicus TaxID=3140699 RepID=UPI002A16EBF7|nr:ABC transporter ATP-binding protein [Dehalococcoidia bacterium]MBK9612350.1 ABC transporter ATP-binding protein [Dehalococcoidia bacterium]